MHFTIEKIIKNSASCFRSGIQATTLTENYRNFSMHFVNLCIPLGDKFEDARYIFVCLCLGFVCCLMQTKVLKQILGISRNLVLVNWIKAAMPKSLLTDIVVWGRSIHHHSLLISQHIGGFGSPLLLLLAHCWSQK